MTYSHSTYHSKLYRAFQEIEGSDYRTQVRFFEERTEAIEQLEQEEYFDLLFSYVHALFEMGAYAKYLKRVDRVLEITIQYNVQFFQGKDLFCELLYQKAASHYQMMEYDLALHTVQELVKIAPDYPQAAILFKKTTRRCNVAFIKGIQAGSVLFFFAAAAVIAVEIFYIQNFLPEYITKIEMLRIGLLLMGILTFALGELYLAWRSDRKVNRFVKAVKKKKGY